MEWILVLLLIFHHQSQIGKILFLKLCAEILLANQTAKFFITKYLKEEVNDEVYFSHAEKLQNFLQVDTTILDMSGHA